MKHNIHYRKLGIVLGKYNVRMVGFEIRLLALGDTMMISRWKAILHKSKVLLAVDRSTLGKLAAVFIANHIWPEKTVFRVIHVIATTQRDKRPSAQKSAKAESLVLSVANAIRKLRPDAKIEAKVLTATNPRTAILSMALRWQPDMIIVGSGNRSNTLKGVLGSVSTAVACQSPCSVHILKSRTPTGIGRYLMDDN